MILDTIVARKKEEVAELKKTGIQLPAAYQDINIDGPRGFKKSLVDFDGVSIIAEVKKASPSKGVISHNFDPVSIAEHYQQAGAQAVSVLTDIDFFQGSLEYMLQVRAAIVLPVIRKDFMIDPIQIEEASQYGADAILLIAAILDQSQLADYQAQAKELGMDALVEVHNEEELELALGAKAELIGVNNRNLNDFTVDIETTFRLKKLLPADMPLVSESGLGKKEDFARLADEKVTAALVGESLMRAGAGSDLLSSWRR